MKRHDKQPGVQQHDVIHRGSISTTIIDSAYLEQRINKQNASLLLYIDDEKELPHPCVDAAIHYEGSAESTELPLVGHVSIDPLGDRIEGTPWQLELVRYLADKFSDKGERIIDLPHHFHTFYALLDDTYATSISIHEGAKDSTIMMGVEYIDNIMLRTGEDGVSAANPNAHLMPETPRYELLKRFTAHWNSVLSGIQDLYGDPNKQYQFTIDATKPVDAPDNDTGSDLIVSPVESPVHDHDYNLRHVFDDVGGASEAKDFLTGNALAITHKEQAEQHGIRPEHFILVGPAGTGKTTLVRAFAGSIGAELIEVSTHNIINKYVGESGKNLAGLFNGIKTKPHLVVLFFDEADALLPKGGVTSSERQDVKSIFKQELTALKDFPNIIVAAASNSDPQDFDEAIVRAGRLHPVYVPIPNDEERADIWQVLLSRSIVTLEGDGALRQITDEEDIAPQLYAPDLEINDLTNNTDGYTGADIEQILLNARRRRFLEVVKNGSAQPIGQADLLHAIKLYQKP